MSWISKETPLKAQLAQQLTSQEISCPRTIQPAPLKSGQMFVFGSGVGGELGLGPGLHERRKPGQLKVFPLPLDPSKQLYQAAKELPEIVAVECGGQHTLALDTQGRVWSWGINDQGALGRHTVEELRSDSESDSDSDSEAGPSVSGKDAWWPGLVELQDEQGQSVKVVQMVCADSFSAVLTDQGEVYAWGSFRDPSGVIGFSKQLERQSQPLPKRMHFGSEKVVLLGSGENHIFAVTADETIWAFGANDESQLGRRVSSRFKNNLEPYEIRATGRRNQSLHNIIKITGGAYHTLYINSSGHLYGLGCNNCGQLGLGDTNSHINGPERIEWAIAEDGKTRIPMPPVVDIAAGESHSAAVTVDGRVFTWGANLEGQLGYIAERPLYGDHRDLAQHSDRHSKKRTKRTVLMDMDSSSGASTPPSSNMTSPEKSVLQEHTTMNGQVTRESYKYKFQPLPRQIPRNFFQNDDGSDDNVVMIDAQSRFSIAVSANGRLYTWGSGHCYQLGNEEMEDSPIPFCVTLKTRKCFWARCGGQFTMFLLEPKRDDVEPVPTQVSSSSSQPHGGPGTGGHRNSRSGDGGHGGNPFNFPNGSPARPGQSFSFAQQSPGGNEGMIYRSNLPVPPTSLPTSPVRLPIAATSPAVRRSPRSPQKGGMTGGSGVLLKDATQSLLSTFESVCVSPEKKRLRVELDQLQIGQMSSPSRQFTLEEKMAPWSPTKNRSPQLFNSPMQLEDRGEVIVQPQKKRPTVAQRMAALTQPSFGPKGGMMASSMASDTRSTRSQQQTRK